MAGATAEGYDDATFPWCTSPFRCRTGQLAADGTACQPARSCARRARLLHLGDRRQPKPQREHADSWAWHAVPAARRGCCLRFRMRRTQKRDFWMKDTRSRPLDMVFVTDGGKITSIAANVPATDARERPTIRVARRRRRRTLRHRTRQRALRRRTWTHRRHGVHLAIPPITGSMSGARALAVAATVGACTLPGYADVPLTGDAIFWREQKRVFHAHVRPPLRELYRSSGATSPGGRTRSREHAMHCDKVWCRACRSFGACYAPHVARRRRSVRTAQCNDRVRRARRSGTADGRSLRTRSLFGSSPPGPVACSQSPSDRRRSATSRRASNSITALTRVDSRGRTTATIWCWNPSAIPQRNRIDELWVDADDVRDSCAFAFAIIVYLRSQSRRRLPKNSTCASRGSTALPVIASIRWADRKTARLRSTYRFSDLRLRRRAYRPGISRRRHTAAIEANRRSKRRNGRRPNWVTQLVPELPEVETIARGLANAVTGTDGPPQSTCIRPKVGDCAPG